MEDRLHKVPWSNGQGAYRPVDDSPAPTEAERRERPFKPKMLSSNPPANAYSPCYCTVFFTVRRYEKCSKLW